ERAALRELLVSIFAQRFAFLGKARGAVEAAAAGRGDGPDDPVAGRKTLALHVADFAAKFVDGADDFVAEDAWCRPGTAAGDRVQVPAANGEEPPADDCSAYFQHRPRQLDQPQRLPGAIEHRGTDHVVRSSTIQ